MTTNRIRRYHRLWATPESETQRNANVLPAGFVVLSLTHLTPQEQQQVKCQAQLYQWAYDEAKREADEKFINDWII